MATIDSFLMQAPAAPALPPSAVPQASGQGTQQPAANPASPAPNAFGGLPIWIFPLAIVAMFLLTNRSQSKKQKEQQAWLASLKKGDEVVTNGGLVGRISGLTDNIVTLEVQEKVRLKVLRSAIAGKPPEAKSEAKSEAKPAAQPASETDKK
jgi:preprotein translocase subunit YajC